jgi:hypothetical protein
MLICLKLQNLNYQEFHDAVFFTIRKIEKNYSWIKKVINYEHATTVFHSQYRSLLKSKKWSMLNFSMLHQAAIALTVP